MSAPGDPVRVLVVDDEPLARATLRLLLAHAPEVQLVGECATGPAAVKALREQPVDLVFLDVQMPGMDGFEVLQELGPRAPAVVFVTAYEDFAIKAFEVQAVHYLLKPFDDARFAGVLARAVEHVRSRRIQELARQLAGLYAAAPPPGPAPRPQAYVERLAVKDGERVTLLPLEQVDWVEADDYCVLVHAGRRSHLLRQSLRQLEEQLDPRRFLRIHRSSIVNVERVRELLPLEHGEYWVVLHDGQRLKLSRTYRDGLEQLLSGRAPRTG